MNFSRAPPHILPYTDQRLDTFAIERVPYVTVWYIIQILCYSEA